MMVLEHFHGDYVAQVMRLQLGVADDPTVHLAEPPDSLPNHRRARLADGAPAPGRPEQRRFWRRRSDPREHTLPIRLEELHDDGRDGDVPRPAALDLHASQP